MAAKQIRRLPVLWLSQWGAVRFSRASSLSMQHTLNAPAVLSQRSQRVRQTFSKCFCSMTFTFFFYVIWTNTRAAAPPYKIIIKATITQLFSFKINTSTLCWSWCLFVKWCLFVHCSQPKLHVLALSNLSWAGTTLYVTHKLKDRQRAILFTVGLLNKQMCVRHSVDVVLWPLTSLLVPHCSACQRMYR